AIDLFRAEVHNNLAIAFAKQGRTEEAVEHYLQALRLKPDYAEAHNNLGVALVRKGDIKGAIVHFREALRINPGHIDVKNNLNRVLMMQQKRLF
ncbi:MAG: tetratricopeptide repeat protein, partial [Arenicellales bacterium]|nr:tetratricopeptide repeat protein [Arenicellales bacterium]